MRILIVILGTLMSVNVFAQTNKLADSKITNVTVFLNKAQVTREVKTRIESGKTNLVLSHLTARLDPRSIQVSGKGSFTILGIAHQQNYLNEQNLPPVLKMMKDSVEYLQKQVVFEQSQKEILNKEEQLLLSNQKIGGANQNLTVAELKAMADFYRVRLTDIVKARTRHDEKIKKHNERIGKLQQQIQEQHDLYTRNTSEIVISLSAQASSAVNLEVQYVVPDAGWNAIYDLRAVNTKAPIQLNYKAHVFQNTGEAWNNVNLTLSTANPTLAGVKPELYPWYLNFDRPVYKAIRGRVSGVAPSAAPEAKREMEQMDYDAETTAAYVTTAQTSLNTEFHIALPYTVASGSKPTLVEIRHHELKTEYQYAVAPKLDPDAFLMARILGWEELSLLPGEANVFFEGTFVAKSYIDPANIKDTLSVSLGRDKRIVVKREKLKDFTSRKLIGTNQRDTYAFEISVRNTKNEPVNIKVEDQLPVSQNSEIEVSPVETSNAHYENHSGKLTWDIKLQPNETKRVRYTFEVKYPKDKIVSGL